MLLVQHQEMPAFLIFGRLVRAIGGQLFALERAVMQINASTQPLHFRDKLAAAGGINGDVPEILREIGVWRSEQHESLADRRDVPLE
jgi:hypothetical protein